MHATSPATGNKRSGPSASASKSNNKKRRHGSSTDVSCKTCSYCRLKKMKCDSTRPSCRACQNNAIECEYPQDTRRLTRPSNSRLEDLENKINGIWDFISAANTLARTPLDYAAPESMAQHERSPQASATDGLPIADVQSATSFAPPSVHLSPPGQDTVLASPMPPPHQSRGQNIDSGPTIGHGAPQKEPVAPASALHEEVLESNLSPREARIAGLDVGQDGIISIHGPSSMMHSEQTTSAPSAYEKSQLKASKARLISYAVIQRQSENLIYSNPPTTMDLDGVDAELASHLLDLHWNRQHYAYLLTYRPAIMDSLANGGPWCSKLLLNGMYYTSCLYSDRESLRRSPDDTQSAGDRFYDRFRHLLVDEIVRPSLPSAAALLLTGAALVSQGRISAGWNLCGIGYRMVTDMGCHVAAHARASSSGVVNELSADIENEWRRRLYWGAFITDATQSMYLGRPMTLRSSEGRVPKLFLDTYEELEEWRPYIDHNPPSPDNALLLSYRPKPAFALSTFTALTRLAQISAEITQAFYSLECTKGCADDFMHKKHALQEDLSQWTTELPSHLRFEPGTDTLPPHQLTPHTTFHVLTILLYRPFADGGHLQDHTSPGDRALIADRCIASALEIRKLISAYREAFTLRRAPFLISYAVYSAVIVILRHSKRDPEEFKGTISFFLTALSELQRGCNFGLKKPMMIIRKMFSELSEYSNGHASAIAGCADSAVGQLDLSAFESFPSAFYDPLSMQTDYASDWYKPTFDVSPEGLFDFDDSMLLPDDTLYGLLAFEAPAI